MLFFSFLQLATAEPPKKVSSSSVTRGTVELLRESWGGSILTLSLSFYHKGHEACFPSLFRVEPPASHHPRVIRYYRAADYDERKKNTTPNGDDIYRSSRHKTSTTTSSSNAVADEKPQRASRSSETSERAQ